MSYILEALKKADNERKQEGATGLQLLDDYPSASPTRPSILSGRTFGIILLLLALAMGIYGYANMSTEASPAKKNTNQSTIEVQLEPPEPSPLEKTVIGNVPDLDTKAVIRPLAIKSDRRKNRVQIPANPPLERPPATMITSKNTDTLPFLHELPAEIQAGIPALKFAGHAYATTPEKRMIIINGKILKEGAQIDATSRLEEITWEGVIIESKGVRFKKNN